MRINATRPEGTQIFTTNHSNSPTRLTLNSTSLSSSKQETSCLSGLVSAIKNFFTAIWNFITCNRSKASDKTRESDNEEVNETEKSLSKSEQLKRKAAIQFLDAFYEDPAKIAQAQLGESFNKWGSNANWDERDAFWNASYLHFLCDNEKTGSFTYQDQEFVIEHWMIAYLLSKQPELSDVEQLRNASLLHFANSRTTAQLLIDTYPDLISKGAQWNSTPLHYASRNGNLEVVECLLENGAKPLVSNDGRTPLHETRSLEVAKRLLKAAPDLLNIQENSEETALSLASYLGNAPLVEYYLHLNADYSHEIQQWNGVIHTAFTKSASIEIFQLFLDKDENLINHKTSFGNTPLALTQSPEIIGFLVSKGAHIEEENNDKKTPLMVQLEFATWKCANALISHGANCNIQIENKSLLDYLKSKVVKNLIDEDLDALIELVQKKTKE